MSVSKRVKSPVARPEGHGEEENFTSESTEELDAVESSDVIADAISAIKTASVVVSEKRPKGVRLKLQTSDGRYFAVLVKPLD